ncbi:hypothetical protein GCM10007908_07340 [Rhizobium albus]|nr:hypothetical protein GCM10007908_07340 [Rhizobium albus]
MNYLWFFAVAGGAVILGLVLAYAAMKTRDRTPAEAARGKAKTREMYQERDDETNPLDTVIDSRPTKQSDHYAAMPSPSGTSTASHRNLGPQMSALGGKGQWKAGRAVTNLQSTIRAKHSATSEGGVTPQDCKC